MSISPHPVDDQLDYPESDGKPMGETPIHRDNLAYLVDMLREWYKADPMVYVSGNMFLYYEPGNRTGGLVPDVFVTRGVPRDTTPRRRVYLTWKEGKGPDIVIELTSKSSQDEDMDDKFWLYRDKLKVPEYVVFDPLAEYLDPPLQGWSLQNGEYVPLSVRDGRLVSEVLGLHLESEGDFLRLYDPEKREYIPSPPELRDILTEIEAELKKKERAINQQKRDLAQERKAREQEQKAREEEQAGRLRAEQELHELRRKLEELGHKEESGGIGK